MRYRWEDYSAGQREAQFNNRARVPEHPRLIDDWGRRSRLYRSHRPDASLNRAYAQQTGATLDWFPAPTATTPAPVHAFIHGGYWQTLDKSDFSFVARGFNDAGVHCALLNYDLCPAVDLDTIGSEIAAAIAWLWRSSADLRIDRARIQIGGHSAGAQLAVMSLNNDWPRLDADLPARLVHSVVAISGVYDLQPLIGTSIDQALRLTPAQAGRNSPLRHRRRDPARLLLAVGGAESDVFLDQAAAMANHWTDPDPIVEILPGHDHFTVVDELDAPDGRLLMKAIATLNG